MSSNETPTWRPPPPPVVERRSFAPAPRRRQPSVNTEIVCINPSDNRREP